MKEPLGPWFVNVVHMRVAGRPLCCSPVDYAHVMWSEDWKEVDCAACHRARPSAENDASERTYTRRNFLTIQATIAGADVFMAMEAVASTAIEHPEWDMDERRTWDEWLCVFPPGGPDA